MTTTQEIFTAAELEFLGGQRLGRLATVDPTGAPQNNPVGVRYNAELGTIDIGGINMGATRKYRNVRSNDRQGMHARTVGELRSETRGRVA